MRKKDRKAVQSEFSILALDDDPIMTLTLQSYFQGSGYHVDVENNPHTAIERIRNGHYDILLLDFLMTPICGDQVVEQIRQFNQDLFIILLTGHKSMAPPIKTIRELDIQGYYEKSDRFDQLELLVESCVKSIRQMRTIHSYQDGLAELVERLPIIYKLQDPEELAQGLLAAASALLGGSGALFARKQEDGTFALYRSGEPVYGFSEDMLAAYLTELKGKTLVDGKRLAAPIQNGADQPEGLLVVDLFTAPARYQVQIFDLFVRQSAAALGNLKLHIRLRDSYLEMIQAIRLMVDAKDIYTRGHSDRVSYYAYQTALALGRDETFCERVRVAGLFHDIGKLGVPDEILLKPDKLTTDECNCVKAHPQNGYHILSVISLFRDIAPIVRAHHERPDGKGYPDGLSLEEIPEEARIIALADSYDAMTSTRHYRSSLGYDKAVAEIERGRGTQFDPALVDTFLQVVAAHPAMEEEPHT